FARLAPAPHSSVARRVPFSRAPVLLVANAFGTWLSQALANLVKARGYRVHFVLTGRELLDQAPAVRPDVIVLDADLPDLDSIAVCRTLRHNRAAWDMPVIMITATPATKQQRLAALEAGAWDYVSVLLNPEELTLKVDAMTRLKLEMERALEESAVDPASGLYTFRGLERRARGIRRRHGRASDAGRAREPARARGHGAASGPRGSRGADSSLQAVGALDPLATTVHEGLVDQRGKLPGDVAPVRQLVDHEHDDEVLDRIDGVPAAVRPTPAERPHRRHAVGPVALGDLEPKPETACPGRVE